MLIFEERVLLFELEWFFNLVEYSGDEEEDDDEDDEVGFML